VYIRKFHIDTIQFHVYQNFRYLGSPLSNNKIVTFYSIYENEVELHIKHFQGDHCFVFVSDSLVIVLFKPFL